MNKSVFNYPFNTKNIGRGCHGFLLVCLFFKKERLPNEIRLAAVLLSIKN